jgi:mitochondrial fission protein ELM1
MGLVTVRLAKAVFRAKESRAAQPWPEPEKLVLEAAADAPPTRKPPVRIYLGTEVAQRRAERVFFWSIEQVRDKSRAYEIYLMKDLAGFRRRWWLTGFTNYRFAIPNFAGAAGRAIYNDVDQIYLADPAELFDTQMQGHGYLSVAANDTSVMLLDCAKMAEVWSATEARTGRKNDLLARASLVPELWGKLAPEWNARDEEYRPGRSKVLHYTALHRQPWRPFPEQFVYQNNPNGHVWFDLERSAERAGYQVFSAARPSRAYRASNERKAQQPGTAELPARLLTLLTKTHAQTCLFFERASSRSAAAAYEADIILQQGHYVARSSASFAERANKPAAAFDAVASVNQLHLLPDEDLPWAIAEMFRHARKAVYVEVKAASRIPRRCEIDGAAYWLQPEERWHDALMSAAQHYPDIHWQLVCRTRTAAGRHRLRVLDGGRELTAPVVWVLAAEKPGHTTQAIGLAETLGWAYAVKRLPFKAPGYLLRRLLHTLGMPQIGPRQSRRDSLAAAWPDLVIATGWLPVRVARWMQSASGGASRLVLMGRKSGPVRTSADIVVGCAHFHSPPDPRRVETVLPPTRFTREQLQKEAANCPDLFGDAPKPHIVAMIGGSSKQYLLDAATAGRLGEELNAFASTVGGSVFAVTSRRTGAAATRALAEGLDACPGQVHAWRSDAARNPYAGYLARADILVVTGESESMLAEAACTGAPLYIYPIPSRRPSIWLELSRWVHGKANSRPLNRRGTERPQQGLEYICARLMQSGLILPPRDLEALHQNMLRSGIARAFSAPGEPRRGPGFDATDEVARRVRELLGVPGPAAPRATPIPNSRPRPKTSGLPRVAAAHNMPGSATG